jgi:hypothetical protein
MNALMSVEHDDRPIFVLGCPRSGTTLLQLMLHGHPRIAIPPETRFLIPTYTRRLDFGDLEQRANRRALARFIVRPRGRFEHLGLRRKAIVRQIVNGPPTVGSALGIVLRGYGRRFDSPRWGDKRPAYYERLDVILRLFPDAHIVHIVRDPRDSIGSLKVVSWARQDIHHAIARWGQSMRYVDRIAGAAPVTEVSYERLVTDPERELRSLAAALGEEYDAAMAVPQALAPVAVPQRKVWHANTAQPPNPGSIGRWRERLEPWEVQLCERAVGAEMAARGYELSNAGRPPLREWTRYLRIHAHRGAAHRRRLLQDRWMQRSEPNPVAARLTRRQRQLARGA